MNQNQAINPLSSEAPKDGKARSTFLPTHLRLQREYPLSPRATSTVTNARKAIRSLLNAEDQRILVISGPCGIHDADQALEYARHLKELSEELSDKIILVMRVYFEKPRTTVGWKGFIHDPQLTGESNIIEGLRSARKLLLQINELGVPCATEFLSPVVAPYLEDLIAYGTIGSRTCESQIHREMASGASMPIGLKNGMDGSLTGGINAVNSSQCPHSYLGTDANGYPTAIQSVGNPDAHLILRGGNEGPNYDESTVAKAAQLLQPTTLQRPILVDCSHGNSRKNHRNQPSVAHEILRQFKHPQSPILGFMLESNLEEGNQPFASSETLKHGVSLVDACLSWNQTQHLLRELASEL